VSFTRVTFVVADGELWWWRGLVAAALVQNATGIDPTMLIRYWAPGLQLEDPEQGGGIRVGAGGGCLWGRKERKAGSGRAEVRTEACGGAGQSVVAD
jgi:hypothetical protein